ncbi:hypothetical protein BDW66DRAFT_91700 [Aspergillus desertorum]
MERVSQPVSQLFVVTISLHSPPFYNIVGPQMADLITFLPCLVPTLILLNHLALRVDLMVY